MSQIIAHYGQVTYQMSTFKFYYTGQLLAVFHPIRALCPQSNSSELTMFILSYTTIGQF